MYQDYQQYVLYIHTGEFVRQTLHASQSGHQPSADEQTAEELLQSVTSIAKCFDVILRLVSHDHLPIALNAVRCAAMYQQLVPQESMAIFSSANTNQMALILASPSHHVHRHVLRILQRGVAQNAKLIDKLRANKNLKGR